MREQVEGMCFWAFFSILFGIVGVLALKGVWFDDNTPRDVIVYYKHEDRIGKMANVNNERLMIMNHNFWASTYTMSNGVEVDDDLIDNQFPRYFVKKGSPAPESLSSNIFLSVVIALICCIGPVKFLSSYQEWKELKLEDKENGHIA